MPGAKFCESCGTALPMGQAPSNGYQNAQAPPQYQAQPQYQAPPPAYGGQSQYGPQPYGQPMYASMPMKSSGIAVVLAFLLAGLGHIYLGQIGKGIIFLILYVILWVVGFFVAIFTLGLGLLIPIIFWIWQMYDAYKGANQYNATIQQTGRAPW